MSGTRSATLKAPATEAWPAGAALLLCSHGSPAAGAAVAARARGLRGRQGFQETAGCLLYGEPRLEEVLAGLSAEVVRLVPLFMAEGVTLSALRARLADLPCPERVQLCPPLGSHPALADHVAETALAGMAERAWSPSETALVLVGHGSRRSEASRLATERLAGALARGGAFAGVAVALLENGPALDGVVDSLTASRAVVIGCFAEAGAHAAEDVPQLLSRVARPTAYLGPLGMAPWVDDLILDQAAEPPARAPRPAWHGLEETCR